MEVKVSFVVRDKSFNTPEEALAYEHSLRDYQMYDSWGGHVGGADGAVFVYFPDQHACCAFIEDCEADDIDYEGLYPDCSGWWWWQNGQYVRLDDDIVNFFVGRGAKFE